VKLNKDGQKMTYSNKNDWKSVGELILPRNKKLRTKQHSHAEHVEREIKSKQKSLKHY